MKFKANDKVVLKKTMEDRMKGEWLNHYPMDLWESMIEDLKKEIHTNGYVEVYMYDRDDNSIQVEARGEYWYYPAEWFKLESDKRGIKKEVETTVEEVEVYARFKTGDVVEITDEFAKQLKEDVMSIDLPFAIGMENAVEKGQHLTVGDIRDRYDGLQSIEFEEIGFIWTNNWFKLVKREWESGDKLVLAERWRKEVLDESKASKLNPTCTHLMIDDLRDAFNEKGYVTCKSIASDLSIFIEESPGYFFNKEWFELYDEKVETIKVNVTMSISEKQAIDEQLKEKKERIKELEKELELQKEYKQHETGRRMDLEKENERLKDDNKYLKEQVLKWFADAKKAWGMYHDRNIENATNKKELNYWKAQVRDIEIEDKLSKM